VPRQALFLLAHEGYDGEEYRSSRCVLVNDGVVVRTASTENSIARDVRVDETSPDLVLDAVDASGFDAVVVVGGPGAAALAEDGRAQRILQAVAARGGILAGIGLGVLALARAGCLRGRRAVWNPETESALREAGARPTKGQVVVDGNVVTAADRTSALRFGGRVAQAMRGR
jgi:protease I